jgi:hypothetical protein
MVLWFGPALNNNMYTGGVLYIESPRRHIHIERFPCGNRRNACERENQKYCARSTWTRAASRKIRLPDPHIRPRVCPMDGKNCRVPQWIYYFSGTRRNLNYCTIWPVYILLRSAAGVFLEGTWFRGRLRLRWTISLWLTLRTSSLFFVCVHISKYEGNACV